MKRLLSLLIALTIAVGMISAQEDDLDELARYSVGDGGELTLISGESEELHEDLWILMIVLLPTDYVEQYIVEYAVFNSQDTLAYVGEIEENRWEFGISVVDDPERALTVIHEFAHILSLNNTQYDTYPTVIADNDEPLSDDDYFDGIEDDMEACPTIAFEDGCPIAGSYLEQFTNDFWDESDVEQVVNMELDDSAAYFYDQNPDAFVTQYAATNPAEDFAESFSYYIGLSDSEYPADESSERNEKIVWFEQFPELVAMRESIRGNAAANGVSFVFSSEGDYYAGDYYDDEYYYDDDYYDDDYYCDDDEYYCDEYYYDDEYYDDDE